MATVTYNKISWLRGIAASDTSITATTDDASIATALGSDSSAGTLINLIAKTTLKRCKFFHRIKSLDFTGIVATVATGAAGVATVNALINNVTQSIRDFQKYGQAQYKAKMIFQQEVALTNATADNGENTYVPELLTATDLEAARVKVVNDILQFFGSALGVITVA